MTKIDISSIDQLTMVDDGLDYITVVSIPSDELLYRSPVKRLEELLEYIMLPGFLRSNEARYCMTGDIFTTNGTDYILVHHTARRLYSKYPMIRLDKYPQFYIAESNNEI